MQASSTTTTGAPITPDFAWKRSFRALRHRDFRLFLAGQIVSLSGTWMQSLAQSWLIYRLTHSTVLMGALGFFSQIPVLLLGPLAGICADRFPRRTIVILAQTGLMVQAFVLAWLTLSNRITVTQTLALAGIMGIFSAFEIPARQSLFVYMVGREDLPNAITLNSMTFNAARLVGPAFGGFFVAAFGEGMCFLLNALSFLAVLASLRMIHPVQLPREMAASAIRHIGDGFRYAWQTRPVRVLLGATALVNLAIAPVIVLNPVFADEIFHRGSFGLGLLTGAFGLGAVIGTFVLAQETETYRLPRIIAWSAVKMGLALILLAVSPFFLLSLTVAALAGFSFFRQLAASNSFIQTLIRDDYRGRIMSIYSMMVVGMVPVGNLISGWVAVHLGARGTVFAGALLALAAAGVWVPESGKHSLRSSS